MKRTLRLAMMAACALLMAIAPGMDFAIQPNASPDGVDLFGYVYQLIARTAGSVESNRLVSALLFAVCLLLTKRYLFRKPAGSGLGEYLLCGFLGGMMLLSTAVRTQDTVTVLWANAFQLVKTLMSFAGLSVLLLMLLRALKEGLEWLEKDTSRPVRCRLDTFWGCFAVLALAWLPHQIARYPGVLMWDSYLQIKQFMGETERWSSHPPFGTLLYGMVAWIGEAVGNRNLIYFCFTLLQCAAYIAVLAYSLFIMKRQGGSIRVRMTILALYAISPCYVGWATVIAKDTSYQIAFLLMLCELLVFLKEPKRFGRNWKHPIILACSFLGMMLSRHNGAPLAALVAVAMVLMLLKQRRELWRVVIVSAASFAIAFGTEAAITAALQIQDRYMQDVLSLPFQQTARVVVLHGDEIPGEEKEIIDRVVDYDGLKENYLDWYADPVKDTYRQTATSADRTAYWNVWLKQLLRYPSVYLDAALDMNGVLFDLNDNRPMYIAFTDMELHTDVYPYSFNDMTMYDREALVPLDSAQRAFTEWYMKADTLPLLGMAGSMSFHTAAMLMLLYLCAVRRQYAKMLIWLPAVFTFGMCLFAPVVYLRYALPLIGSLPMGVACMLKNKKE